MAVAHDAFISYSHSSDGEFGPALERGLEKLAKPLFRLRALDTFIDRTGLTASPGLWPSILDHLAGSKWFVLIASPESAASPWCNKEIAWWLDNRPADRLLVALTDGDIVWDPQAGDFDWSRTTALSPVLQRRFPDEPLYVDLRWARGAENISLSNPRFREDVVSLAAPIHGMRRDELDGADVRQLRRNRLLVRTGILVLAIATGVAVWQATVATREREEATYQRDTALARYLAIQAADNPSSDLGILLAIESLQRRAFVETDTLLRELVRSRPSKERAMPLARAAGSVFVWQFSPSGRYFVSKAGGGHVVLWDVESLKILGKWAIGGFVSRAVFSRDERHMAIAGGQKVAVIEPPNGKSRTVLEGLGEIASLAFNPDGSRLAVGLWTNYGIGRPHNGHVVIDISMGTLVGEVVAKSKNKSVAFSPDGRYLGTSDNSGTVMIWDADGGFDKVIEQHEQMDQWSFDASTNALVTLGRDRRLEVHTATATGESLPAWNFTDVERFALSPRGDKLAIVRGRVVDLYDRAGKRVQRILLRDEVVRGIRFLNQNRLAAYWDDGMALYDVGTGRPLAAIDRPLVAFGRDGTLLLTAEENWLQLWRVGGGDPLTQTRHGDKVCSVAFDRDGTRLITASEDGTARVWTVPDGEQVVRIEHERPVTAAWFSPDGKTAVSAGDGLALWWETGTGRIVKRLEYRREHSPYFRLQSECRRDGRKLAVSFVRAMPLLASATAHEEIDVYDFSVEAPLMTVTHRMDDDPLANRGDVLRIEFGADGTKLRTANSNRERPVRTWDIETGHSVDVDAPEALPIKRWPLPIGPAGRYRADWANDHLLIRDGDATVTRLRHPGSANDALMSPDGRYVATAGADGTVNLFLIKIEDLIADACRRVAVDITPEQWDRYIGFGEARRICPLRSEE